MSEHEDMMRYYQGLPDLIPFEKQLLDMSSGERHGMREAGVLMPSEAEIQAYLTARGRNGRTLDLNREEASALLQSVSMMKRATMEGDPRALDKTVETCLWLEARLERICKTFESGRGYP